MPEDCVMGGDKVIGVLGDIGGEGVLGDGKMPEDGVSEDGGDVWVPGAYKMA